MSINTIIEEQETKFQEEFVAIFPDREADFSINASPEKVLDWHTQSIKQILEAEVERLKGMKKETKKEDFYYETEFTDGAYTFHKHRNDGYNNAIDDQITHLTNIIKEIK